MIYANLNAEMGRKKLTMADLQKDKDLNLAYETIRNKFAGRTDWTRREMFIIQKKYFPDKSLEYLFNE